MCVEVCVCACIHVCVFIAVVLKLFSVAPHFRGRKMFVPHRLNNGYHMHAIIYFIDGYAEMFLQGR